MAVSEFLSASKWKLKSPNIVSVRESRHDSINVCKPCRNSILGPSGWYRSKPGKDAVLENVILKSIAFTPGNWHVVKVALKVE